MRNSKGNVLIYTLIVINLALILVYIVSSRTNSFLYSILNEHTDQIINSNIKRKADIAIKYDYLYNLNGTGFIDSRLCPTNLVFSGTTLTGSIFTITGITLDFDSNSTPYCSGSSNSGLINIFYSDDFLSFDSLIYSGVSYLLSNDGVQTNVGGLIFTGNVFNASLSDYQNSILSFSGNIQTSGLDSNFNSDNYKCSSTGIISYPSNKCDDDINARQNIYGYIEDNGSYYNIFWNNSRIDDFLSSNTNNSDSGVVILPSTSSGYLFLNISDSARLKLISFDKDSFDKTNELKPLLEYEGYIASSSSGYISFSGTGLSLNSYIENGIIFDFKNKNYSLFLSYSGASSGANLDYILTGFDYDDKPLIINPIDDSNVNYFKFLGYDIFIGDTNKYYYKITQIEAPKNDDIIKNNFVN